MRLHHCYHAIPADGAAALRHFYGELLGLPEIPKAEELGDAALIWFGLEDSHLHFCLDDSWQLGHPDHHIALYYDDLDPVRERLQQAGLKVLDRVGFKHYGYKRSYVYDPFGRQVELLEPLPTNA